MPQRDATIDYDDASPVVSEPRLTKPLLAAMASALRSACAGEGFDGGDFDGQNPDHFARALAWVEREQKRRTERSAKNTG